jgi:hypothetical protein
LPKVVLSGLLSDFTRAARGLFVAADHIMSNKLHTVPNPGPPVGKVHDCSFDKEKTLMRTIQTEGTGPEAREGSMVVVHFEVSQPGDDGKLYEIFRSKDKYPQGLRFEYGRNLYSEALERTIAFCKPGSVIDSLCTDPEMSADPTLGIVAKKIPEGACEKWQHPRGPVGNAQGAIAETPMFEPKPEDVPPRWRPSEYVTLFHVRLDSVTEGVIPMHQDSHERIEWVAQRKAWASELYKRGLHARALRHYKKAMLDLETPVEWLNEAHVVERNQLRTQLHLNVAACGLKMSLVKPYPNLSTPKTYWDPHLDVIHHCSRVLRVDKHNVKALYRRALAHLMIPSERHINGLALALEDLSLAHKLEPDNGEVLHELKRARGLQKQVDQQQQGLFTKMIGTGELV